MKNNFLRILLAFLLIFACFLQAEELNFDEFENEFQSFEINDPFINYNKAMTKFNVFIYDNGLVYVLKTYDFIMPDFAQTGVNNFFDNLLSPLRFVGNLLQFKFKNSLEEFARFAVNSTLGVAGLFDVGTQMGLKKHQADFGLVLAHWGVKSGPHIVLPFFGPSNLRDTLTMPLNWYSNPSAYITHFWPRVGVNTFARVNEASLKIDEINELYHGSANLYPFLRDAYEQNRAEFSK